jgi:hypothetical protein
MYRFGAPSHFVVRPLSAQNRRSSMRPSMSACLGPEAVVVPLLPDCGNGPIACSLIRYIARCPCHLIAVSRNRAIPRSPIHAFTDIAFEAITDALVRGYDHLPKCTYYGSHNDRSAQDRIRCLSHTYNHRFTYSRRHLLAERRIRRLSRSPNYYLDAQRNRLFAKRLFRRHAAPAAPTTLPSGRIIRVRQTALSIGLSSIRSASKHRQDQASPAPQRPSPLGRNG